MMYPKVRLWVGTKINWGGYQNKLGETQKIKLESAPKRIEENTKIKQIKNYDNHSS